MKVGKSEKFSWFYAQNSMNTTPASWKRVLGDPWWATHYCCPEKWACKTSHVLSIMFEKSSWKPTKLCFFKWPNLGLKMVFDSRSRVFLCLLFILDALILWMYLFVLTRKQMMCLRERDDMLKDNINNSISVEKLLWDQFLKDIYYLCCESFVFVQRQNPCLPCKKF